MKEEEEDNKLICVSTNDEWVLSQDICVMCGALGTDQEGRLIVCTQCGQCYHPHCVNVRVTQVILQKGWRCLECTICEGCGNKDDEANLILCDECDISFHIYCMDPPLEHVPQGTWKCKWRVSSIHILSSPHLFLFSSSLFRCAVCTCCGANDPGFNSQWFENYSLCGPCHSLGQCTICEETYEEAELIIQCCTCKRWCHGECDSIITEDDAEKCAKEGYSCQLCRPNDVLPAHLAAAKEALKSSMATSPQGSPDYGGSGGMGAAPLAYGSHYSSNSTFIVDGVVLTDRGMACLKAQTVEKEKARRRKRIAVGFDAEKSISETIEAVVSGVSGVGGGGMGARGGGGLGASGSVAGSADTSMENELEAVSSAAADDMDEDAIIAPGLANPNSSGDSTLAVEGGGSCPPTGGQPDIPEGRKRRYRDLKKVGIGGFQAKSRSTNKKTKNEPEGDDVGGGGDKPKKRQNWRPKKNKILTQYPEYIQDSFFGREFIESCGVDPSAISPSAANPDGELGITADEGESLEAFSDNSSDGCTIQLNVDALRAVEEMKREEKKRREAEEEAANKVKAKAKAEEAAKKAAEEASNASGLSQNGVTKTEKDGGGEDDLMADDALLPSDIFGDDIFKSLMNDDNPADDLIDDDVLDEAEKEDAKVASVSAAAMSKEEEKPDPGDDSKDNKGNAVLADALATIAPELNLNSKDMDDILNNFDGVKEEPDGVGAEKTKVKTEEDSVSGTAAGPTVTDASSATQAANMQQPIPQGVIPTSTEIGIQQSTIHNQTSMTHQPSPVIAPQIVRPQQHPSPTISAAQGQHPHPPISSVSNPMSIDQPRPINTSGMDPSLVPRQTIMHQQQHEQPRPYLQSPGGTGNGLGTSGEMQQPQQRFMHPAQQQHQAMMQQQHLQREEAMRQQQMLHQQRAQQMQQHQPLSQPPQQQIRPPQQPQNPMSLGSPHMRPPTSFPQQQHPQPQSDVQTNSPSLQQHQQLAAPSPYHQPEYPTTPGPTGFPAESPATPMPPQQPQPGPWNQQQQQQQQPAAPPSSSSAPPVPGTAPGVTPSPVIPTAPQTGSGGPQAGPSVAAATPASVSTQRNQLLKWESDEPLGENATIAMILFSNKNHPNLKTDYPVWSDRIKQIAKIWKSLPIEKRQPYVQQARENRTASRMNKQVRQMIDFQPYVVQIAKHVVDNVYYIHINMHTYVHALVSYLHAVRFIRGSL